MVQVVPRTAYVRYLRDEGSGGAVIDWLTTTDHKRIGIMYVVATMSFSLVIAGLLALP